MSALGTLGRAASQPWVMGGHRSLLSHWNHLALQASCQLANLETAEMPKTWGSQTISSIAKDNCESNCTNGPLNASKHTIM